MEEPVIINKYEDKDFLVILPCGCVEVQHSQSKESKAVSLKHKFCTKHKADYEQRTKEIIDSQERR